MFYDNEFNYKYLLENGVEVEATIISYDYHSESSVDGDSDYNSGWYYIWECTYNGKTYNGTSGGAYYRTEEQVLKYIGKKITITVDPNSNWAVDKPLSEIHSDGFHFKEYLNCAIIFTCLSPFGLFIFIGFVVYPLVLDYKIDRSGKLPQQGEVIKISGFVIYFIKVKYKDKNGAIKEKWSYSWFTKSESKYLSEKSL